MRINRSKSQMKAVFSDHGIPCAAGRHVSSKEELRLFARRQGFPLIVKPDVGVGSGGAFRLDDPESLEAVRPESLRDAVVEELLEGTLLSFDGLTNQLGEVVFCTSHVFSSGIMEVVAKRGPMHYYSLRDIPTDLESLGRKIVSAFAIRGRFFHIELFRGEDESLRVLELNVRPPGGFTTDMFNYAADIDVYRLWAEVVSGRPVAARAVELKYHVAHAARREGRHYVVPHHSLLKKLGPRLLMHQEIPPALSGAMGDYVYLIRSPDLRKLRSSIAEIEREGGATNDARA